MISRNFLIFLEILSKFCMISQKYKKTKTKNPPCFFLDSVLYLPSELYKKYRSAPIGSSLNVGVDPGVFLHTVRQVEVCSPPVPVYSTSCLVTHTVSAVFTNTEEELYGCQHTTTTTLWRRHFREELLLTHNSLTVTPILS